MALLRKLLEFKFLRFILAGSVGVGLYYIILLFLTEALGVWYIASAIIASIVNCGSNFLLQKFWVFGNKDTNGIHQQAINYAILFASLAAANPALLYLLVEYFELKYFIAPLVVIPILTIASYLMTRRIFAA